MYHEMVLQHITHFKCIDPYFKFWGGEWLSFLDSYLSSARHSSFVLFVIVKHCNRFKTYKYKGLLQQLKVPEK